LNVRLNIAKPRAWHGLEAVLGPALSLAHIENKPCLEAPHNIVGSLFRPSLFAPKKRWLLVYIRLLFACRQDFNSMPMPAMPGRFQSIASAGATRHRKEVLEGDSLVAILFR